MEECMKIKSTLIAITLLVVTNIATADKRPVLIEKFSAIW